jgi:hypothetical protein
MLAIPTVDQIAEVLARAPKDQPWFYEGPTRHLIRAYLCRHGWRWLKADRRAFVLVAHARDRNGVRVPTGWDSIYDPHSWVIISCCPICDRPVRQGQRERVYCSRACNTRADRIRQWEGLAIHQRCWECNNILIDPRPDQKYCTERCRIKASSARRVAAGRTLGQVNRAHLRRKAAQIAREAEQPRLCPECNTPLPPGAHRLKIFCSDPCKWRAENQRRRGNGHAKPNGHCNDHGPAADLRPNGAVSGGGDRANPAGADRGTTRRPVPDPARGATGGAAAVR